MQRGTDKGLELQMHETGCLPTLQLKTRRREAGVPLPRKKVTEIRGKAKKNP